jgi:hypothetical protein
VLGIYASGYNINVPVDGRAPDNMTVHASMAAFHLMDSKGEAITGPRGQPVGGRILADLSNWQNTPNRGFFTLVGGVQSSVYDNLAVFDGRMHGYTYKGVWDARYDANFSPAWYPGYFAEPVDITGGAQVTVRSNTPVVLSYKRVYYGSQER